MGQASTVTTLRVFVSRIFSTRFFFFSAFCGLLLGGLLLGGLVLGVMASSPSFADAAPVDCANDPNVLGTSRTIYVDPAEHPRIGVMQYPERLALDDHEVVLTFDDGPQPKHTRPVLDILAANCVKATFFMVGRMAREYPQTVRQVYEAGHTIGTHSENHPVAMDYMPIDKAIADIEDGITSTQNALGETGRVTPFFRFPGLARTRAMEDHLAERGQMIWSADFPIDDWRFISPAAVVSKAMSRLEAKGSGIMLLHDIHARTQAALPALLKELKARNFRIVHVAVADEAHPATPTSPRQWLVSPPPETSEIAEWPPVPEFQFVARGTLVTPEHTPSHQVSVMPPRTSERWLRTLDMKGRTDSLLPAPDESLFRRTPAHEAVEPAPMVAQLPLRHATADIRTQNFTGNGAIRGDH